MKNKLKSHLSPIVTDHNKDKTRGANSIKAKGVTQQINNTSDRIVKTDQKVAIVTILNSIPKKIKTNVKVWTD